MNKDQSHLWLAPDFDEIMDELVSALPQMVIGGASRKPKFYWGQGDDLLTFLNHYKEDHFPLCFSVSKEDEETDDPGIFQRTQAELNLCTPETNVDMLNTLRIDKAFGLTLKPFWVAIHKAISRSPYVEIVPGTLGITKFPNWSVTSELEHPVIWDVMRVRFDARINIDFYCNSQK